jgi:hypothetical protein
MSDPDASGVVTTDTLTDPATEDISIADLTDT